MNPTASQHIELLKSKVLLTAGYQTITPADCKVISSLITGKTKQTVSETTLKRIYGFALSKFNPSMFTIDVLAKYCGYIGWTDFVEKQEVLSVKSKDEDDVDWHTLQQNASKITNFTLQALKNKSGIPYNQTISRKFIEHHIDGLLNSDHTGALFAAPAGYGKTIALCHWVDKKMEQSAANNDDDIILFFSSNALMSVLLSGKDINDWMLSLLGYSNDNTINALAEIKHRKKGKFYLVVDGFDEHMFKNDQFEVLLNHIIDVFSFYQSHDWFKIILTIRSSTWINNRHEMEKGNNSWFTNFKTDDACVNVPLFSLNEIKELCHKINPSIQNFLAIEVAESFNHPLYFQFYYKQYKENFTLNNIDHLCIYELVSMFIFNKVYLGQHSAEKILLIETLVNKMDIANQHYNVDKIKVSHLLKQYHHAYNELISVGYLKETNVSDNYHYSTFVQFGNTNFLDHSMAKTLLYKNNDRFDSALIQTINTLFANNPHKVDVLKWCIMYAIKTGQLDSFERLTEATLSSNEKSEIILFLGDLLDKECSSMKKTESLMHYFKQDFSKEMFHYFFGLELITTNYKKTLTTLLKFELANRKKILVYSSLAILAIINLDLDEANEYITKLKSFGSEDYKLFAVNPLHCLESLYQYFKHGVIKKAAIVDLTRLYFYPPEDSELFKNNPANDFLFLLGLYTLMLCQNPKKTLRFIAFLNKYYKTDLQENSTSQYDFFVKTISADAYYQMGESDSTVKTYYSISEAYKKGDNLLTPYMKTLFYSTKIKALMNSDRENSIPKELKLFNATADESGSKLSKVYICQVILKSESLKYELPDFYRQVKYDFKKIIHDAGINPDFFLQEMIVRE